jgi:hypothetical protein
MVAVELRAPRVARLLRRSALLAGAALGAFHVWLLGHQAWSGQLANPATTGRWAVALALLGGLLALRRRGLPMLAGRQAVALWLLAALLHGPALLNDHDGFAAPAMPEVVVTVAQAAASFAALGAALLLLLRHGPWALGAAAGLLVVHGDRLLPSRAPARQLGFLPRPPPLA